MFSPYKKTKNNRGYKSSAQSGDHIMHPAKEIKSTKSSHLQGKRIILAVTGSIAATETVKLARELIRHGAEIIAVLSEAAQWIITPDALEFATGHKVITKLTGNTEHVTYCGIHPDKVDLLLICPATANTISKIAAGIDDTPVTTFATTAIGSNIPILIVPAMHRSMYAHPLIQRNIETLNTIGIRYLHPKLTPTKAKLPSIDHISSEILRLLGPHDLEEKRILIIGGATAEPIDDIRILSNTSSGKTAISLATEAYRRGADISLWLGKHSHNVSDHLQITSFQTHNDLKNLITTNKESYDIIINCAAIADYTARPKQTKIPSEEKQLNISLQPTEKLMPLIKEHHPKATLIGYKAESNKKDLDQRGNTLLEKYKIDYVICNTTQAFNASETTITILHDGKKTSHSGDKTTLANHILDMLSSS